jgi:transcriptional regulator with GAF, ATPase, and Fis domain
MNELKVVEPSEFYKEEEHDKIKEEFLPIYKKDINVLIEGETGTGKSHLAKIIHVFTVFAINVKALVFLTQCPATI